MTIKIDRRMTVSDAVEASLAADPSLNLEQALFAVMDVQRARAETTLRDSSSQPPQASAP